MTTSLDVKGVEVVHWNPRAPIIDAPILRRLRIGSRVNNFGDLLGPMIVQSLVENLPPARKSAGRLLSVGSIVHFASDGDVVWGSGVNGKIRPEEHRFSRLDVRAVRGPKTREFLADRGVHVPTVFGDPALLLPQLRPDLRRLVGSGTTGTVVIPNLNDVIDGHLVSSSKATYLDPRSALEYCLRVIVSAERVISSSLHGLVVAEAFGVPVTLVRSHVEPMFKFEDYVLGTGRTMRSLTMAESFKHGLAANPKPAALAWDASPLLAAFPADLWSATSADPWYSR